MKCASFAFFLLRGMVETQFSSRRSCIIRSLSAKPLFDVLRTLIAEAIRDTLQEIEDRKNNVDNAKPPLLRDASDDPLPLTIKDRDALFGILGFIAKHYDDFCNQRNDLLHGTWFVRHVSEKDPYSAEFFINRLKATKSGLSPVTGLPKSAAELESFAARCENVRLWIGYIEEIFKGDLPSTKPSNSTARDGG